MTKKRKVLNGMATGDQWDTCCYKAIKGNFWIAISRGDGNFVFTIGEGLAGKSFGEGAILVPTMQMPYDLYLEAERLLNFAQSTKDKTGRARVTVISKLLRHLLKARYGAATEFGTLLRKMFEKTKLEEE